MSQELHHFHTLDGSSTGEYNDKGSRFLGFAIGVPGLIRAYKAAAGNAIASGFKVKKEVLDRYQIKVSMARMGDAERLFKQTQAQVTDRSFNGTEAIFQVVIPRSDVANALEKLLKLDYLASWQAIESV